MERREQSVATERERAPVDILDGNTKAYPIECDVAKRDYDLWIHGADFLLEECGMTLDFLRGRHLVSVRAIFNHVRDVDFAAINTRFAEKSVEKLGMRATNRRAIFFTMGVEHFAHDHYFGADETLSEHEFSALEFFLEGLIDRSECLDVGHTM
mgnify:CR=1 FL=1